MIVGGSIEGLILSILSAKNHNVTLIDIHPELGFPCSIPGWLEKKETLQTYLTDSQINQLNIFQNNNGFAVSGEWLFKLLTIKAVHAGVNVLLRCRVTNVEHLDKQITIQYAGGINGGSGEIICNQMFDLTDYCAKSPGNLQHSFTKTTTKSSKKIMPHKWGGIALSKDCHDHKLQPILQFFRNDDLCELWFQQKPTWTPSSGWLETMINTTPSPLIELSIDNSISYGEHLFESINQQ